MKAITLFILCFIVPACGIDDRNDWYRHPAVDPPEMKPEIPEESLRKILMNFLDDCGVKHKANVFEVNKIEYIRYGDVATEEMPTRVGICVTYTYESVLFKSNITVKKMNTEVSMKALLYHELGHCILGLGHTKEFDTMMSPFMLDDEYYKANWNKLVKDMCNKYE